MKKVILFLCLALTSSGAMYAQAKQEKSKKQESSKRVGTRLEIEFISVGQGIDAESLEKIESYAKSHPKKPAYNVVQKGREGERKLYFGLAELTPDEQTAFVEEVKKLIVKPELVKVVEPMKSAGKSENKPKKSVRSKPEESAK